MLLLLGPAAALFHFFVAPAAVPRLSLLQTLKVLIFGVTRPTPISRVRDIDNLMTIYSK